MKNILIVFGVVVAVLIFIAATIAIASAAPVDGAAFSTPPSNSCLIVRSGQSHKARNATVVGIMTLGVGAAPAALMSGTHYERVDSFGNGLPFKQKYSGKALRKLDRDGVHVVVVAREADIVNPRGLCGFEVGNQGPLFSPQANAWLQIAPPMQTSQPIVERRNCTATQIMKNGDEFCTAWAHQ